MREVDLHKIESVLALMGIDRRERFNHFISFVHTTNEQIRVDLFLADDSDRIPWDDLLYSIDQSGADTEEFERLWRIGDLETISKSEPQMH